MLENFDAATPINKNALPKITASVSIVHHNQIISYLFKKKRTHLILRA